MIFHSYSFIFIFLPVFLLGIYFLQTGSSFDKSRGKLIRLWMILMSILFFVFYGVFSVTMLCISIIWNAGWGYIIKKRHISIIPGIVGNVLFLCFFKYNGSIGMPVAVSFYTFQQIAFLAQLQKGEIEDFCLMEYLEYILFFPKLLQGPLADYREVTKEFDAIGMRKLRADDLLQGMILFILGLSKKVLLSTALGFGADYGYQNLQTLTGMDAVITALCYSLQLYFDFSGYCDMAEGICKMIGMKLTINFNAPYRAANISEFWDRWHMSLTHFFTKYVYIPLGGSRRGVLRTYVNILIVFLISGIWHGAGITFIVWGLMHGVLMVITRAYGIKTSKKRNTDNEFMRCFKVFMTFLYVSIAWVFFRAPSVSDALTLLGKIVTPDAWSGARVSIKLAECFQLDELWYVLKVTPISRMPFGGYVCMWMILFFSCIVVFAGKNARNLAADGKNSPLRMILLGFLFMWCVLSLGGVSTFLYVNF